MIIEAANSLVVKYLEMWLAHDYFQVGILGGVHTVCEQTGGCESSIRQTSKVHISVKEKQSTELKYS
jgi:hypothetical protein